VDLKKAFDTVNKGVLIYKLSCLGIKAKFLNIIKNMHREDNYCVKLEEGITDKWTSKVGVKRFESKNMIAGPTSLAEANLSLI
jgi:hypothetical protein